MLNWQVPGGGQSKSSEHFGHGKIGTAAIQEEMGKICSGMDAFFHVMFVFVTDGLAGTTFPDSRLIVVDAHSLDMFAGPVTSVIRHASKKRKLRDV